MATQSMSPNTVRRAKPLIALPLETLQRMAGLGGANGGENGVSMHAPMLPSGMPTGAAEPGPGAPSQQWPAQFRIDPAPAGAPLGMERGAAAPGLPGREAGGAVAPGQPVNVGEQGQEWFQPASGGAAQPLQRGVFNPPTAGTVTAAEGTAAKPASGVETLAALGLNYVSRGSRNLSNLAPEVNASAPETAPASESTGEARGGDGHGVQMPSYTADQTGEKSPSTGPGLSPETSTAATRDATSSNSPISTVAPDFKLPKPETGAYNAYQKNASQYNAAQNWLADNPDPRAHGFFHSLLADLARVGGGALQGFAEGGLGGAIREAATGGVGSPLGQRWYNAVAEPGYNARRDRMEAQAAAAKSEEPGLKEGATLEGQRNQVAQQGAETEARLAQAKAQQENTNQLRLADLHERQAEFGQREAEQVKAALNTQQYRDAMLQLERARIDQDKVRDQLTIQRDRAQNQRDLANAVNTIQSQRRAEIERVLNNPEYRDATLWADANAAKQAQQQVIDSIDNMANKQLSDVYSGYSSLGVVPNTPTAPTSATTPAPAAAPTSATQPVEAGSSDNYPMPPAPVMQLLQDGRPHHFRNGRTLQLINGKPYYTK